MRLQPGDIALTPRGSAHCLLHAPSGEILVDLDKSWLDDTDSVDNDNGHGEPTRVIYGYTLGSRSNASPLHTKLATLVRLRRDEYESVKLLDGLLELVESEERQRRPGWREIVNQLVQLMFYQSLRAFINGTDAEPEHQGEGVQSVVSDPAIGLVVGLLHNQPGDPWTVASLARWINMSRSAFSERFRDVIGQPPLHYLTEVRMARACHMLANTELSVKQIAALVGYESPSSFTNAFKRWNGTSPASYRTATVCQP
jgi:AraC-like DNA-binding protein